MYALPYRVYPYSGTLVVFMGRRVWYPPPPPPPSLVVFMGSKKGLVCPLSLVVFMGNKKGLVFSLSLVVFMGSKKYPGENTFDVLTNRHGGHDNASTDYEKVRDLCCSSLVMMPSSDTHTHTHTHTHTRLVMMLLFTLTDCV